MASINRNGTLKGKTAVVTGASRGIGAAICTRLAMEGAKVIASARTAESGESNLPGTLQDTVEHIRSAGGEATMIKADLSKEDDRIRLIEQATEIYGPVDILVNDAAVTFFIPVETFPKKRFDLMFEVQVWAPMHLAQLVLPSMRERKQGWIVNISSGAAFHPQQPYNRRGGGTVYGMCKAALERFTTGLASEVFDDNVAVNVISPGLVDTPGVAVHGLINEQTKDRVQPIEYIAEGVYQMVSRPAKDMTGRIGHAAPFLKDLGLTPSQLV